MQVQPAATILASYPEPGMFDIGSKAFISATPRGLYYTDLTRTAPMGSLPLRMEQIPTDRFLRRDASIVAIKYDEVSALLVILTLLYDPNNHHYPSMQLFYMHFPSGQAHPEAAHPTAALRTEYIPHRNQIQLSVYGDKCAVVFPWECSIFNWETGSCLASFRGQYQSLSFLSDTVIAFPNALEGAIELWGYLPVENSPGKHAYSYITELPLPETTSFPEAQRGSSMKWSTSLGTPRSLLNPSRSSDSGHLTLDIDVPTETARAYGLRETRFKWVMKVDGLLRMYKHRLLSVRSRCERPRDKQPWRIWGQSTSSCFDASGDVRSCDYSVRYHHILKKLDEFVVARGRGGGSETAKYSLKVYSFPANETSSDGTLAEKLLLDIEVPYCHVVMDNHGRLFGQQYPLTQDKQIYPMHMFNLRDMVRGQSARTT